VSGQTYDVTEASVWF